MIHSGTDSLEVFNCLGSILLQETPPCWEPVKQVQIKASKNLSKSETEVKLKQVLFYYNKEFNSAEFKC